MRVVKCFQLLILLVPLNIFSQTTGKISGRVIDLTNNKPFEGCNIKVSHYIGGLADADGHFLIENIPFGYYNIEASYFDHKSVIYDSILIGKENIILNFSLEFDSSMIQPYIVENHAYLKEGFSFWWKIKMGNYFLQIPTRIDFNAKYLKEELYNNYKFLIDSLKLKYPEFYNDVWNNLENEINLRKKFKEENDPRLESKNFTDEDLNSFIELFEKGIITFNIPTYSKPIPFEHDSIYSFIGEVRVGKPSRIGLFISKKDDLYFAGVTDWNTNSPNIPLVFPIQFKESQVLKEHYNRIAGELKTNLEIEFRYGNDSVLMSQCDQKQLGNWTIYQGLARRLDFVEGMHVMDYSFNGTSFTIVRN
ncbi:MAG: carboxypeptidase-like regulatory domain-containing protein [Bacteroidetes bacterium]|nr:carboxypeptidase-like regulatory domain-containing protein [Bacteroidota bacterium]MBU1113859.1 carboxypeptidase-like regulatory domain-containing protein [Bacteroidota bacterium]MBU1798115.1 carboxypeptidase-like regulatory domain-containing protein [Bacteroidota bacterium]